MSSNGKSKRISIESVPELPQLTKCAHCDRTFPVAVPILGAPQNTEYVQLVSQLAQHLMEKHPKIAKATIEKQMHLGIHVSGLLVLENFDSQDEGLGKWRDYLRHLLHDWTAKNRISDATIEEKVGTLFPSLYGGESQQVIFPSAEQVIQLVKEVRDILEEKGMYPVENVVLTR